MHQHHPTTPNEGTSLDFPTSIKPQTYHEYKVLPCVCAAHLTICGPLLNSMSLGVKVHTLDDNVADVSSYASPLHAPASDTHSPLSTTIPPCRRHGVCGALQMEVELTVAFLAFTECYRSHVMCVP